MKKTGGRKFRDTLPLNIIGKGLRQWKISVFSLFKVAAGGRGGGEGGWVGGEGGIKVTKSI